MQHSLRHLCGMLRLVIFICLSLLSLPANAFDLSAPLARAISERNWHIALAETRQDSILSSYVRWRALLDEDFDTDFAHLARFINEHPDWPRLNHLRLRAEKTLFQTNNRSAPAKEWLAQFDPISGYGMLALARITGEHSLIRKGWIQGDFERSDEELILNEFASSLDKATHRDRIEHLLKDGNVNAAERLLDYAGDAHALLYRARIALQRDQRGLDAKIAAVPESLAGDQGLLADRAKWHHAKGYAGGARELLLTMQPDSPYAAALWRIRAAYARDAIEAGHYQDAAKLLSSAGTRLDGAAEADALWLHGWLELVFRKRPRAAYKLFYKLYHAVQYPVSKARGAFWAAQASEANGNESIAVDWLKRAAVHPTVFYGQLAQQKLYPGSPLALPAKPPFDAKTRERYAAHPHLKLARLFNEAGMVHLARPFIEQLASSANSAGEYAALLSLAQEYRMQHAQVRIAKSALKKHIVLHAGWPVIETPKASALASELSLAIARQESEFNSRAVSSANARGLMQLLPSTGRRVARKLSVTYRLDSLFDPVVNMRLGGKYLYDLIEGFDGNYILAIAGYNAGPGRSRQWVERFGLPGKDLEQTLKFIELIPFAETRNYVQRVLENTQVYRELLAPGTPLALKQDLLR